jgi:hypothetical protein
MRLVISDPFFTASLAGLMLVAGCADLKAIRTFADTAADSAGYTSLSADYPKSIERQKRYQDDRYQSQLDRELRSRQAQQPALLGLHKGIEEYIRALGALASDELVSYDASLDSLAADIRATKLIDDAKADAFAALTKRTAKAATEMYRRRKLKRLIADANGSFQIVVGALIDIVGRDFVSSLDNESVAADKYYREIVAIAEKAPPQQASVELLKERWQEKTDALKAKKEACVLYVEVLKKIGNGHQLLFDNRDRLSSGQLRESIHAHAKSVKELYRTMKDLR